MRGIPGGGEGEEKAIGSRRGRDLREGGRPGLPRPCPAGQGKRFAAAEAGPGAAIPPGRTEKKNSPRNEFRGLYHTYGIEGA